MTSPVRFRRRPTEVEAVRWDGTSAAVATVAEWGGMPQTSGGNLIICHRDREPRTVAHGDWVLREPGQPGVFTATADEIASGFEPVGRSSSRPDVPALIEELGCRAARIRERGRAQGLSGYRRMHLAGEAVGLDAAIRLLERL